MVEKLWVLFLVCFCGSQRGLTVNFTHLRQNAWGICEKLLFLDACILDLQLPKGFECFLKHCGVYQCVSECICRSDCVAVCWGISHLGALDAAGQRGGPLINWSWWDCGVVRHALNPSPIATHPTHAHTHTHAQWLWHQLLWIAWLTECKPGASPQSN